MSLKDLTPQLQHQPQTLLEPPPQEVGCGNPRVEEEVAHSGR